MLKARNLVNGGLAGHRGRRKRLLVEKLRERISHTIPLVDICPVKRLDLYQNAGGSNQGEHVEGIFVVQMRTRCGQARRQLPRNQVICLRSRSRR